MNKRVFVDTNILVYALDRHAKEKQKIAQRIVLDFWNGPEQPFISTQVLSELHVSLVKKGLSISASEKIVRDYSHWQVVRLSEAHVLLAIQEQRRWKLSYWDALILVAARSVKADFLLTEDLQSGQLFGGVRVLDPFV